MNLCYDIYIQRHEDLFDRKLFLSRKQRPYRLIVKIISRLIVYTV